MFSGYMDLMGLHRCSEYGFNGFTPMFRVWIQWVYIDVQSMDSMGLHRCWQPIIDQVFTLACLPITNVADKTVNDQLTQASQCL